MPQGLVTLLFLRLKPLRHTWKSWENRQRSAEAGSGAEGREEGQGSVEKERVMMCTNIR
jgi:hypothetical protein